MNENHARNPADLPAVTLDTNALIAVRDNTPDAKAAHELLDMNRAELITIYVTLSTALEAGRDGKRWAWADESATLESWGIAKANIFTTQRTIGFQYPAEPGVTIFDEALSRDLMERVHEIVHWEIPFQWRDYRDRECQKAGLSLEALREYDSADMGTYIPPTPHHPSQKPTPTFDALDETQQEQVRQFHEKRRRKWNNAKNDSLGLYCHLTVAAHMHHPEWSVFVTSDDHFLASTKLPAFRKLGFRGEILRPAEAVNFLRTVTNSTSATRH